jgi:hypothetical protein
MRRTRLERSKISQETKKQMELVVELSKAVAVKTDEAQYMSSKYHDTAGLNIYLGNHHHGVSSQRRRLHVVTCPMQGSHW